MVQSQVTIDRTRQGAAIEGGVGVLYADSQIIEAAGSVIGALRR